MAKVCMIERDKKRKKLVQKYATKRAELKAIIKDQTVPADERFQAVLKLAELPRNSSKVRTRTSC
jgi:small subunit ribosomal protein S14